MLPTEAQLRLIPQIFRRLPDWAVVRHARPGKRRTAWRAARVGTRWGVPKATECRQRAVLLAKCVSSILSIDRFTASSSLPRVSESGREGTVAKVGYCRLSPRVDRRSERPSLMMEVHRSTTGKLSRQLSYPCPAQSQQARPTGASHRRGAQEFTVRATQPADRPKTRMDAGLCARNLPSTWAWT